MTITAHDEATAADADASSTPTDPTPSTADPTPEAIAAAPTVAPEMPIRLIKGLRYDGPEDFTGQERYAAKIAAAKGVPDIFRDSEADAFLLIQRARDLDIPITTALDHLYFSRKSGKWGMSAKLMHALLHRAGHSIRKLHADSLRVRLALVRGDGKPGALASWTIEEARVNGLLEQDRTAWIGYPGDMLWARCLSRVARRGAPEATLGMYEVSEVDSFVPDDVLDSVDMSTAMRGTDGTYVPSPDVAVLIADLGTLTHAQILERRDQAAAQQLMGAYAGTYGGIDHTVGELLWDAATTARDRERTAAREAEREAAAAQLAAPPADGDGDQADAVEVEVPVEEQPAGTGDRLPCSGGCMPAEVLAQGNHNKGCDRHVAGRR